MRVVRLLAFLVLDVLVCLPPDAEAAQVDRYFRSFDGTKIHYEINGAGPAVLLIHGFTVNAESWKETKLFGDLLSTGFKVIALDLRGNGLSDKPRRAEAYAHDAEARDVRGLVRHLRLGRYAVVGYSRGSIIAARLAISDKRVTKVVLGGMGDAFTDPNWQRRLQVYRVLMGEPDPEYAWVTKRVDDMGLDRRVQAYIQLGQPSTSAEELSTINVPVLVICGDKDESDGSPKVLAGLIPGAQYVSVPGDHAQAWFSQALSSDIISFLKAK